MSVNKLDMELVLEKRGWNSYVDVTNKLMVHVTVHMNEISVDSDGSDPDGLPLVYLGAQLVTRVRKLTDEEFEEAIKKLGSRLVKEEDTKDVK